MNILIVKKLVDILRLVIVVIVNVALEVGICGMLAGNEKVLLQVWNSLLVLPGTAAQ